MSEQESVVHYDMKQCETTKMACNIKMCAIPTDVMVVVDTAFNIANAAAIGSIYDGFYPSYTILAPWMTLSATTFPLLGVRIVGGHEYANPNIVVDMVKTVNSFRVYDMDITICVQGSKTIFFLRPQETDVFLVDAFCYGLQAMGIKAAPQDSDDDESVYSIEMPSLWRAK